MSVGDLALSQYNNPVSGYNAVIQLPALANAIWVVTGIVVTLLTTVSQNYDVTLTINQGTPAAVQAQLFKALLFAEEEPATGRQATDQIYSLSGAALPTGLVTGQQSFIGVTETFPGGTGTYRIDATVNMA